MSKLYRTILFAPLTHVNADRVVAANMNRRLFVGSKPTAGAPGLAVFEAWDNGTLTCRWLVS
jgi:hypothetical protein